MNNNNSNIINNNSTIININIDNNNVQYTTDASKRLD